MTKRAEWTRIALVLAAAAWASACSSDSPDPEPQVEAPAPVAAAPVDPLETGRTLYEANCLTCHGVRAAGDGPAAAALPEQPANILEHLGDHSYEDMVRMVGEGIPPAMPAAVIPTNEVRLVLNYIWSMVPDTTAARLRALAATAEEQH